MPLEPQQYETAKERAPIDRLSFIRPRANRSFSAGHSRAVRLLRGVLPAAALLVLIALIVWPMISADKIAAVAMKNIPNVAISNLHFTGVDSKNEPYSLTAEKATRPGGQPGNLYDFDKPQAEITLANGTWVAGRAKYGRYNQDTRQLWLGGDVQLFQDRGYQFTTDEAQVDMDGNQAWGARPILIQGDFGTIHGQGFRVFDSGKVVVVTGPAHATLDLHKTSASDKPASASK